MAKEAAASTAMAAQRGEAPGKSPSSIDDRNAHPRDEKINLEEDSHTYTIDGFTDPVTSVTTLLQTFFEPFDADAILDKYYSSWQRSNKRPNYKGKTRDEIKKMWSAEGVKASAEGTKLHKAIEVWYAGEMDKAVLSELYDLDSPEWKQFLDFCESPDGAELVPFRTEMKIWSTDHGIAGTIDLLSRNNDGTFSMYDWKRSKHDINPSNTWNRYGKMMLVDVPDTSYGKYCMQLNLYKHILEEFYGYVVSSMYLVRFHPSAPKYQLVEVPDWSDKARKVLDLQRAKLLSLKDPEKDEEPTGLESLLGNLSLSR